MKLFQIEEPDGSPSDPTGPGVAIGLDASGRFAEVAVAVGGNAALLTDREGFERALPVPGPEGSAQDWQALFEGARLRAERALGRPVTHAVLVLAALPDAGLARTVLQAAAAADMTVLRLAALSELGEGAALAAAIEAEDSAPRPEPGG